VDRYEIGAAVVAHSARALYRARELASQAQRALGRPSEAMRRRDDAAARIAAELRDGRGRRGSARPRNILFVTTDQQRFDSIGAHGQRSARTPVIDGLVRDGVDYLRCHVQNVVCMPSRATLVTGQHPLTHGVVANGVALPGDAPSVFSYLRRMLGYRTALIGKAHFDPHLDPSLRFDENRLAAEGSTGPFRGFEHAELATHGPLGGHHYAAWLHREHPEAIAGFGAVLTGAGGGDTGAPEVKHNRIPRELYHTDWVADRTIAWLRARDRDEPWVCWMSFPDPHHPLDPPYDEVRARIDWRDLPLPDGHPGSPERIRALLARRPRHWLDWYEGRYRNPEGGPISFTPATFGADRVREVNAMVHVENELVDEAIGRVLGDLAARGALDDTDVVVTTDHGELQGDLGLMFKGPYHVDALLRVPLIWRPARRAGIAPGRVTMPVGLVDVAPTLCAIAGVPVPEWMQGAPLPLHDDGSRERVITSFDSQFAAIGMHLRTIHRDGWTCTTYLPSDRRGGRFPAYWAIWGRGSSVPRYDGTEGELYDTRSDPHGFENRWGDPAVRKLCEELVADLHAHLPPERETPLPFAAPT
jgi:arylsulfatase A-like enzyme